MTRLSDNAACRALSPAEATRMFLQERPNKVDREDARWVCSICRVFEECRAAIDTQESGHRRKRQYMGGFWAGETVAERIVRRMGARAAS